MRRCTPEACDPDRPCYAAKLSEHIGDLDGGSRQEETGRWAGEPPERVFSRAAIHIHAYIYIHKQIHSCTWYIGEAHGSRFDSTCHPRDITDFTRTNPRDRERPHYRSAKRAAHAPLPGASWDYSKGFPLRWRHHARKPENYFPIFSKTIDILRKYWESRTVFMVLIFMVKKNFEILMKTCYLKTFEYLLNFTYIIFDHEHWKPAVKCIHL